MSLLLLAKLLLLAFGCWSLLMYSVRRSNDKARLAFSDGGLHHMPVINAQRHVVGMVTQSDLVAALFQLMGAASSQPMRQA